MPYSFHCFPPSDPWSVTLGQGQTPTAEAALTGCLMPVATPAAPPAGLRNMGGVEGMISPSDFSQSILLGVCVGGMGGREGGGQHRGCLGTGEGRERQQQLWQFQEEQP